MEPLNKVMTEQQYQLDKCYSKYPKVPKRTVKKLFNRAWFSSTRLGNALNNFEAYMEIYQQTKEGKLK